MAMGGILDFSTESTSTSYVSNVTNTDSNNRSAAQSSVLDNVGNLTLQIGGQENLFDRWLPVVAVGFLLVAFTR